MIRTALRLAVLAALTDGGNPPGPTIAQDRVYDSRSDPLSQLMRDAAAGTTWPVIVILSGDDRNGLSDPRGSPVRRVTELSLQFGIQSIVQRETSETPDWPVTDAGLEAALDVFDWQIRAALLGHGAWARWFRGLRGIYPVSLDSLALYSSPERGRLRLAVRHMQMQFAVPQECLPRPVLAADAPLDGEGQPVPPPATLVPLLLEVFDKIAADGAGQVKADAAQLRATLQALPLPVTELMPMFGKLAANLPDPWPALWPLDPT